MPRVGPGARRGRITVNRETRRFWKDGRLVVAGQRELLAGSAFETDICVPVAMDYAGVTLKEAVDMTSRNPARTLGFEQARLRRGGLATTPPPLSLGSPPYFFCRPLLALFPFPPPPRPPPPPPPIP